MCLLKPRKQSLIKKYENIKFIICRNLLYMHENRKLLVVLLKTQT